MSEHIRAKRKGEDMVNSVFVVCLRTGQYSGTDWYVLSAHKTESAALVRIQEIHDFLSSIKRKDRFRFLDEGERLFPRYGMKFYYVYDEYWRDDEGENCVFYVREIEMEMEES